MQWLRDIGNWFEARLELRRSLWPIITHPVPRGLGWWYVFGSSTLTLFLVQVITGICLAMVYVPSTEEAYLSLEYLNYQQYMGWVLRAIHYWAASGMVVMLALHMTRVFLFGAFKYPRELTWLTGVALLVLTLAMAFTGQVLRWDQNSYWAVGVGAAMAGRVPGIGPQLVNLILGGETISGETLTRFFGLHVFLVPALLFAFLGVHLYLVVRRGISQRPDPNIPVDPDTEDERYEKVIAAGEPFWPNDILKDAIFACLTVLVVIGLALTFGPNGPAEPPDPTLIHAEPRPDWYFLPLFAVLALSPPDLEVFLILVMPVVVLAVLVLLPFVANRGQRHPSRRPMAVLTVVLLYVTFIVLAVLGDRSPWSPDMFAWSKTPVPERIVERLAPVELAGAAVFQLKDCRNCHALDGTGGERGPDLTDVAARLTENDLIRQVTQGGGMMPAYGKQLAPHEVRALVAFLRTLRPSYDPPAEPTAPGG